MAGSSAFQTKSEDFEGKKYENKGIPPNIKINYSWEWNSFYDDFYHENEFNDKALDKIEEFIR